MLDISVGTNWPRVIPPLKSVRSQQFQREREGPIGSGLCSLIVDNHSGYEVMTALSLPCPEDSIKQFFSLLALAFYFLFHDRERWDRGSRKKERERRGEYRKRGRG